jgi:hypothetical protein
MPAFEIIFRLALQLLENCNSESWLRSDTLGAAISLPMVDRPFTKKILRQALQAFDRQSVYPMFMAFSSSARVVTTGCATFGMLFQA